MYLTQQLSFMVLHWFLLLSSCTIKSKSKWVQPESVLMTFFHCQLKITWVHVIFYCVRHYCTRIHLCDRSLTTTSSNDTRECFLSQSYQNYLQNTFKGVLAAGFTVMESRTHVLSRSKAFTVHQKSLWCRKEVFHTKAVNNHWHLWYRWIQHWSKFGRFWSHLEMLYLVLVHLWSLWGICKRGTGLAGLLLQNFLHLLKTFCLSN